MSAKERENPSNLDEYSSKVDAQPLWLIRLLRWMPRTDAFDCHLTDCAALAVFYHPCGEGGVPPLTWRHVLKLDPLPPFIPQDEPRPANVIWLH